MMTKEQYLDRAAREDDWAPGWEAIDEAFARVYPDVNPPHLASQLPARAVFGGPEYLDGISFFESPKGYQHALTYGMTSLYVDEDAVDKGYSRWGYEMTMKIAGHDPDDRGWVAQLLGGLASYTYTEERWLEAGQFVDLRQPIDGRDTLLQGLLVVEDTEVPTTDSPHGPVEFLQLFGVTRDELDWLREDLFERLPRAAELARRAREAGNPDLVTDIRRRDSLLE